MRTFWLMSLAPLLAFGQTPHTPTGALVRGVLLERDSPAASGQLSIRAADNQVFRYRFDPMTYVEREDELIDVARLKPGDTVEVLSDKKPDAALRYAMTIHVLPSARPKRLLTPRTDRFGFADRLMPVGDLSFTGVVARVSPDRLVLRTRTNSSQTILLLKDTSYVENGKPVDIAALKPNMRVYIRAGKSLYDDIEAYQVVWGQIMSPR